MDYRDEVEETLRNLAKPPGSLGLLDTQVKQIFLVWGGRAAAGNYVLADEKYG